MSPSNRSKRKIDIGQLSGSNVATNGEADFKSSIVSKSIKTSVAT
jgi:hypothetical protein